MFPMIAEVVDSAGLPYAAIDRIAVTLGPGTFTGVRVGIAAARALALALGRPVVGVTSLAAMALRAGALLEEELGSRQLVVAVDAHRGMLFVQSFAAGGRETGAALLLAPEEAALRIAREGAVAVGSGASALAAAVSQEGGAVHACLPDLQPHARILAEIASALEPIAPPKPLYLRAADAKLPGEPPLAPSRP
jgi:tRNA threonylcarbamoyladenosine biosynthesis protein TsaB